MDQKRILHRIEELNERLDYFRGHNHDSVTSIAIEAVEQELARTAARLRPDWDFFLAICQRAHRSGEVTGGPGR